MSTDGKKPGKVRIRLLGGYMRFIERFENAFERRMPKVFLMYKKFKTGFTSFIGDFRTYHSMSLSMWSGKELSSFPRKELQVYKQVPEDIRKMAPILVISILPLAQYLILPLVFYFPTRLLSRHFWTYEEKQLFRIRTHNKCVPQYPLVLNGLQKASKHLNDDHHTLLNNAIEKIKSTKTTTPDEIMRLKPVFSTDSFQLENMSLPHKRHLAKSLNLRPANLVQSAFLYHYIDKWLLKEGVTNLPNDDLQLACFWRGLNPELTERKDLENYLNEWLHISRQLNDDSISLLLHSHVFLLYGRNTSLFDLTEQDIPK